MKIKKNDPIIIERTFNAPVTQVWQAITDKNEMKQWFFDLKQFQPKKGFEFDFSVEHKGVRYEHLCRITEVIVNKKLSYSWRYEGNEGDSLVTFELFPAGEKTRLRLTHKGLETFPALPEFARKNFVGGWTSLIGDKLKKYTQEIQKRQVIISHLINAPVKRVWEAFADTKQVVQWWGPKEFTTTTEKREFKPGGVWQHTLHGPDGTNYPNRSVFITIEKYKHVVYSHGGGRKGSERVSFKSTWTFEAQGPKTRVTMRMLFPSPQDLNRVVKEFGAREGGKQTLGRLNQFVNPKKG